MHKKAQITIFIILGLMLVVILLLVTIKQDVIDEPISFSSYDSVLGSCLDSASKDSIYFSFYSGHNYETLKYVDYHESFHNFDDFGELLVFEQKKPVYINKITDYFYLPEQDKLELLNANLFNLFFKDCLVNADLGAYFSDVFIGDVFSTVEFSDKSVLFSVDYLVRITEGNSVLEKKNEFFVINYAVKEKFSFILDYLVVQNENDFFSVGYLSELAYLNDFQFVLRSFDSNTLLVEFIFNDFENIYNKELRHVFAVSFDRS